MKIITLTTDFGVTSEYPAAMKGVILSINPNIKIIDISHSILPQNIYQGAFILYSIVPYFQDAIHIGVVDPGVGTARDGLIFKCKRGILVGPDNGLLIHAAERLEIESIFKITNTEFCLDDISTTFHGRDIFAPVAANISKGTPPENIGDLVKTFERIELFDAKRVGDKISGKVLNIDHFGNIITNISKDLIRDFLDEDDQLLITTNINSDGWRIRFKTTYGAVKKGEFLAIISSSGFLELAGNQCSANEHFNLSILEKISIQKVEK